MYITKQPQRVDLDTTIKRQEARRGLADMAKLSNLCCLCAQSLAEAFHGWQEALHHQRDLQDRLAGCLQRWRLQGLAAAFQAFQANAVKQRKAKAVQPYPGPSVASTKLTHVLFGCFLHGAVGEALLQAQHVTLCL